MENLYIQRSADGIPTGAINQSDTIRSLKISASTEATVEVPAGSKTVIIANSSGLNVFYKIIPAGKTGSVALPTNSTPLTDTAGELHAGARACKEGDVIHMICAQDCDVTLAFYGKSL